jgi:hypothetical protein
MAGGQSMTPSMLWLGTISALPWAASTVSPSLDQPGAVAGWESAWRKRSSQGWEELAAQPLPGGTAPFSAFATSGSHCRPPGRPVPSRIRSRGRSPCRMLRVSPCAITLRICQTPVQVASPGLSPNRSVLHFAAGGRAATWCESAEIRGRGSPARNLRRVHEARSR